MAASSQSHQVGPGVVLGVLGSGGGVGASVLAAAVAVRAAAARRLVVAVDGDRCGGGVDVLYGVEQEAGVRWTDLLGVRGPVDGPALLGRLPTAAGVRVLSFDRQWGTPPSLDVVADVLGGLARSTDLLVVDLPKPADPLFAAFAGRLDCAVLVCGDGVRSLAAASLVGPTLAAVCPETVICMRGSPRSAFGDVVAEALGLPLLTWVRPERSLAADLVHGYPPATSGRSGLARAADLVLAHVLLVDRLAS
ncbi:MAG TPA: septum site-determining protein Ssd [Dermatophilaceae bacterium]|nr:septum site-determining protein Ssd [Dermatophilaceae bacterium]